MPSFNHTRGSIKRLMRLSGVVNYKIFLDNFGGRVDLKLDRYNRELKINAIYDEGRYFSQKRVLGRNGMQ